MEDERVGAFKPIFNRARGALHPASPHARNAALLPFLIHVYPCNSTTLVILASDFHSNTWHTTVSLEQLNHLKEKLACKGAFLCFLQSLHEALCSSEVVIELGGPASAVGGKGATSALLKASLSAHGTSKDLSFTLDNLKSRNGTDASATLALDLYNAYFLAQNRILELEANLEEEKQKSVNVLDAILEGKAASMHFRQSSLPNIVHNEEPPSWSGATSPGVLLSTQSPTPSINLGSYLSPSIPSNLPNEYSPGFNMTVADKTYKSSESLLTRAKGLCRTSALKLCEENSYSRSVKKAAKAVKGLVELHTDSSGALATTTIYEANDCDEGGLTSYQGVQKRKYRELNSDLITKIESGGENRSAKTDTWARRHYMEWRRDLGLLEKEIEEIPLPEFAESLVKFFCMVKKRNGDLFPSESLKAMYRAYVRILQANYKKLRMEGSYSGAIVDAAKDTIFEKARIACVEAMKHSLLHGANTSKKRKTGILATNILHDMLLLDENQVATPSGLCRRLCYYCIHKFGIDDHMELYDTTDIEFERMVSDQGTAIWNYNERKAEKYKRKELFRAIIQCDDKDVVECFDKYFMHLPPKPLAEEPRRLFLAPIKRPTTTVWFRHQNISSRTLQEWYRYMKPRVLEDRHGMQDSMNQPPCLLRCEGDCQKGIDVDENVNMPAMDMMDENGNDKATQSGTSGNNPEIQGDLGEDGNEGDAEEDRDEDDLTDVD
ncbi:hypothetical protein GOP47_0022662 [Adiantum capillus-veneris]|uniref:Uncharacterized protein n=1 Tax=Adiantum capillus-veneris TaxID=13818 RepID=A0A9D4Z4H3_ADICA|nr:hypothetical protein GOP47_0022662 [Adiantum capillus-veneris]